MFFIWPKISSVACAEFKFYQFTNILDLDDSSVKVIDFDQDQEKVFSLFYTSPLFEVFKNYGLEKIGLVINKKKDSRDRMFFRFSDRPLTIRDDQLKKIGLLEYPIILEGMNGYDLDLLLRDYPELVNTIIMHELTHALIKKIYHRELYEDLAKALNFQKMLGHHSQMISIGMEIAFSEGLAIFVETLFGESISLSLKPSTNHLFQDLYLRQNPLRKGHFLWLSSFDQDIWYGDLDLRKLPGKIKGSQYLRSESSIAESLYSFTKCFESRKIGLENILSLVKEKQIVYFLDFLTEFENHYPSCYYKVLAQIGYLGQIQCEDQLFLSESGPLEQDLSQNCDSSSAFHPKLLDFYKKNRSF